MAKTLTSRVGGRFIGNGTGGTVSLTGGPRGAAGPNTVTTSTTTDLTGLLAADGSTVGVTSLDFPIGLYQETVTDGTWTIFRVVAPFRIIGVLGIKTAAGSFRLEILRDSSAVIDEYVTTTEAGIAYSPVTIGPLFSTGQYMRVRRSELADSPSGFETTIQCRRVVQ
jgi:hypothetical protein